MSSAVYGPDSSVVVFFIQLRDLLSCLVLREDPDQLIQTPFCCHCTFSTCIVQVVYSFTWVELLVFYLLEYRFLLFIHFLPRLCDCCLCTTTDSDCSCGVPHAKSQTERQLCFSTYKLYEENVSKVSSIRK